MPELGIFVFIVPEGYVKNGEARLIVPNQIARSVVNEQRNKWVGENEFFPLTRKQNSRLKRFGAIAGKRHGLMQAYPPATTLATACMCLNIPAVGVYELLGFREKFERYA